MKKKNGFTLIELVVVIALIAILAVTLAPRLRDQIAKATDAKSIGALGALRTASEVYFADNGTIPGDIANTDDLSELEDFVDTKTIDLINERASLTAAALPVGGRRSEAQGTSPATISYASKTDMVVIQFATADGIELNFTQSNISDGTDTVGIYDTKGILWASY